MASSHWQFNAGGLFEEGGWPHAEIVGGTQVGDARDVGAGSRCCRQHIATALLLQLLAKRARGRARTVFGWVSRGCTNAQHWKKKRKAKKRKEKKKTKSGLTGLNPHKNADLYGPRVSCMCMALVWACREAREGGMAMAAKRQQWEQLW